MNAAATAIDAVEQCELRPCNDGARLSEIVANGAVVGEIRRINLQSDGIYLGSRRLLLRDDATAAAVARGASRLFVFAQALWRARRWSLHEGEQEIAQLQLHWRFKQGERIELRAGGVSWNVTARSGLRSGMDLRRNDALVGALNATRWVNEGIALQGGGLPLAQAVALLRVVQRSWTNAVTSGDW